MFPWPHSRRSHRRRRTRRISEKIDDKSCPPTKNLENLRSPLGRIRTSLPRQGFSQGRGTGALGGRPFSAGSKQLDSTWAVTRRHGRWTSANARQAAVISRSPDGSLPPSPIHSHKPPSPMAQHGTTSSTQRSGRKQLRDNTEAAFPQDGAAIRAIRQLRAMLNADNQLNPWTTLGRGTPTTTTPAPTPDLNQQTTGEHSTGQLSYVKIGDKFCLFGTDTPGNLTDSIHRTTPVALLPNLHASQLYQHSFLKTHAKT